MRLGKLAGDRVVFAPQEAAGYIRREEGGKDWKDGNGEGSR